MPRYFFHLMNHGGELLDPDGVEISSGAVEGMALRAARDCMAADVQTGELDLRNRIEVLDESGAAVHVLPFRDALEIIHEPES